MNNSVEVGERAQVIGGGDSATQHARDLAGRTLPGAGHGQQCVDRPGQRAAGGLVPAVISETIESRISLSLNVVPSSEQPLINVVNMWSSGLGAVRASAI